jgi:hypothetical protein
VLWPGRWGATRRREYFEGDSPRGPREHPCWWDPSELHREGRPWNETAAAGTLAESRPAPVAIEARREDDLAVVDYEFAVPAPGGGQREPARVVVAPVDERGEVGVARSFPVEAGKGSLALQLPADREWTGVRVCAASALGVPGECQTASFTAA